MQFKPGWNGEARTPPLGWRSWNAFGNRITQGMMMQAAEALVARNRSVWGSPKPVALCDVGYCSVGVDEGWEGCGLGVNGTQHAADGTPTIDSAFPDTKGMVAAIHGLGLKAGWCAFIDKDGRAHPRCSQILTPTCAQILMAASVGSVRRN